MRSKSLIIGFGHHSRRIHYPIVSELAAVDIVGIVDLRSRETEIESYLKANDIDVARLYMDSRNVLSNQLTQFAERLDIDSVIISTGPEAHVLYAKWAFKHGYHVLMDKPVHAEKNAAHNLQAARQVHNEYTSLVKDLRKKRKKYPRLVCEILTQRRYHPGYMLIKQLIDEVYDKTGCPITYYYAFHNDGQWRLPEEVAELDYHGYKDGFGKASHSGYHFYDLLNWFTSSFREEKGVDAILVKAWPNFPKNHFKQIDANTLSRIFPDYHSVVDYQLADYGEVDVMSTIQLKSSNSVITHAQIDLQHSGISARSWPTIEGRNLYKGNGRVRHEQHYINMGPFASISLTSWQSKPFAVESISSKDIYKPGHEFNLDITICRNSKIIGGQAVQNYTLEDIYEPLLSDYSRGHQEDARWSAIVEFYELIRRGRNTGHSPLTAHSLSSLTMASVYESIASAGEVTNEIVKG